MTGKLNRVCVVGGSIAGISVCDFLRASGYDGDVSLVVDEVGDAYQRPPLSKGVLSGLVSPQSISLGVDRSSVDVIGGTAIGLDLDLRLVQLDTGEHQEFDKLVVTTGARARRIGTSLQVGERVLRTLDDAVVLKEDIARSASVIVVGGGFLGMEVASTCANMGLHVTVVDREPPLRRILGSFLADELVRAALVKGVQIMISPGGVELLGTGEISGVRLDDGECLSADLVISAVGDLPNVEWLEGSGLTLRNGLVVDGHCQASADVFAAGDAASTNVRAGTVTRRTPFWSAAIHQARTAALSLLQGATAPVYIPDPYFWTEQGDYVVKMSGELPFEGEGRLVDRGPTRNSAVYQWSRDGRPVGAAAINYRLPVTKLKTLAGLR